MTAPTATMANTSSPKLGWIGIGRMGYAMAERLAKAGADLTVWNRTRAKAEPLAAAGAKLAASPADLAACDIVFVMVSTWDDVKQVVSGPGGLLSAPLAPGMVVECSSISLEGSAELRALLAARGTPAFWASTVISANDSMTTPRKTLWQILTIRASSPSPT